MIKRIIIIALSCIICLTLGLSLWHRIKPNSFFKVFGFRSYLIAYTGSMEPKLKQNDFIIVEEYNFDKLRVGQIITFMGKTNDGKKIPITHKIVKITEENGIRFVQTQGINLSKPDLIPVTKDGAEGTNIYIGRLKHRSRVLGNTIAYVSSPIGISTLSINLICFTSILLLIKRKQKSN